MDKLSDKLYGQAYVPGVEDGSLARLVVTRFIKSFYDDDGGDDGDDGGGGCLRPAESPYFYTIRRFVDSRGVEFRLFFQVDCGDLLSTGSRDYRSKWSAECARMFIVVPWEIMVNVLEWEKERGKNLV